MEDIIWYKISVKWGLNDMEIFNNILFIKHTDGSAHDCGDSICSDSIANTL